MMEHTKEPWSIAKHDKSIVICFQGKQAPHETAPYFAGGGALEEERNANARRIVACVNACKGVPNEQLEMDNVAFVQVFNERNTFKKQRDELLAALEPFAAIDLVESRLPAEFAMLVLRGRAAIAKVKGQCGRINSGHACNMPAGSSCPDCGPSCHSVPEGA